MKQNKREIRQKIHLTGIIGYKKKLTFDILSFQIKGQISRDELKQSVSDGSLLLPPTISVARKMIAMWFGPGADKLTGGESWR